MIYIFKCEKCKRKEEIQMTLEEFDNTAVLCEKCGNLMQRDYQAEHESGIPIKFNGKDFFVTGDKK